MDQPKLTDAQGAAQVKSQVLAGIIHLVDMMEKVYAETIAKQAAEISRLKGLIPEGTPGKTAPKKKTQGN